MQKDSKNNKNIHNNILVAQVLDFTSKLYANGKNKKFWK
jgi:hypothetical protein